MNVYICPNTSSVKDILGLFKHIMYSFAIDVHPYKHIWLYKSHKKIGSFFKDEINVFVKIPRYHAQFLNCIETPIANVHTRKETFENIFQLEHYDHYLIHYTRVIDTK